MPCPGGVDIPRVFSAWNECSLYGGEPKYNWNYMELNRLEQTPEKCLKCGACERACPQHLNIIESLQTAWNEMQNGTV